MAEKPLSATTTMRRSGSQRTICSITCRAPSISVLCLTPRSAADRSEVTRMVRKGSDQMRPLQGTGTNSMADSPRNPLALTK